MRKRELTPPIFEMITNMQNPMLYKQVALILTFAINIDRLSYSIIIFLTLTSATSLEQKYIRLEAD